MAKLFVTDNEDTLEYTYVKSAVQQNGFWVWWFMLCKFAKGTALLNENDASTVEFSSPITHAAIVTCICGHQEHGICLGLNNDQNSNE